MEQNQKVIYIVDSHTAEVILDYLEKAGLRTAGYLASGQFSILDQRIEHLKDRKRLEQSLLESAQLYRTIFNAGSDAIFVYPLTGEDLPGGFIEVNEKACEMLGYTREKLMGLNRMDLEAPPGVETLKERLRTLRERKRGLFETNRVTKQGRLVPVEISSNLVELDGRLLVLSIARDITERRRAEMLEELSGKGGFHDFPTRLRSRDGEVKDLKAHVAIIELGGERCALTMLE